eukprot:jgi/Mesvir1/22613/Mv14058-RA.1
MSTENASQEDVGLQDLADIPWLGERILEGVPLVQRIRLRQVCSSFRSAVDTSLEKLQHLSQHDLDTLELVSSESIPDAIVWLVRKCPNLRSLSCSGHPKDFQLPDTPVDPSTRGWDCSPLMLALAAQRRELRTLSLTNFGSLTDETFAAVAAKCPELRQLDLSGSPMLTARAMLAVAFACPRLQHLSLARCSLIRNAGIRILGERCRDLEHLNLTHLHLLQDDAILPVIDNCAKLRYLKITSSHISGAILHRIASRATPLEHLDLKHCHVSDESVAAAASCCRSSLRQLTLAYCQSLLGVCLTSIGQECGQLVHLDVSGLHLASPAGLAQLGAISQGCLQLRAFLAADSSVTDDGISVLTSGCQQLESVTFSRSTHVTDNGIMFLADQCPQLRHLTIAECGKVTDKGVRRVAERCPGLELLKANRCGYITDASIVPLVRRCTGLIHLAVARSSITDRTLRALAERGSLTYLDVSRCAAVTAQELGRVGSACPNLSRLCAIKCPKVAPGTLDARVPKRCHVLYI